MRRKSQKDKKREIETGRSGIDRQREESDREKWDR